MDTANYITRSEGKILQMRQDMQDNGYSAEQLSPQTLRFLPETINLLEKQGALIYTLTGQSIRDLRAEGELFWSSWHEDQKFEYTSSRRSEVAIYPFQFFLEGSNKKPMDEQLIMLENYSGLAGGIPGARAVLGSVSDYAALAFLHYRRTMEYLFGPEYNSSYTRTTTPTLGLGVALVGNFKPDDGLSVISYRPDESHRSIWVTPLIVPDQK